MEFRLGIEKLFGNWDFDLDFNRPIHYMIGPNGTGKTTILKILSAVSRNDMGFFQKLPFERIVLKTKNRSVKLDKSDLSSFSRPPFQMRLIDEFGMPDWMKANRINEVINMISSKIRQASKNDLRMEMLFNLLKKFVDKQISFSNGLSFRNVVGDEIMLDRLSDGEKRLLVFWYSALFEIEENSLLMIDTPETSLHVEWQYEYAKDLKKIQELHPMNVLISTHSPQIINEDWDSIIDLFECLQKKEQ